MAGAMATTWKVHGSCLFSSPDHGVAGTENELATEDKLAYFTVAILIPKTSYFYFLVIQHTYLKIGNHKYKNVCN